MTLNFEPITLKKQKDYLAFLKSSPWEASDYSFINLWGWCEEYGLQWAWENDLIWLRQTVPNTMYWAPVGRWQQIDWKERMEKAVLPETKFIRIPETLKHIWSETLSNRMTFLSTEDQWDYVYSVADLISLTGNRFHKKKNLLNQFVRNYSHRYLALTEEYTRQAMDMQDDWCVWRDCESSEPLASENRAIARTIKEWNALENICGGLILVENTLSAFTVAEQMNPETVLIHFEKGLTDYKGIYQAINRMFLAANENYQWVNREQDLGDPGLRKAKQSYNPSFFVRKYKAIYRPF